MREAPKPPPSPPTPLRVDIDEHIRATADRLARLPADQVASLSITIDPQGRPESDVRALAVAAARATGLNGDVDALGDVVTVRFWRPSIDIERAD